MSILIINPKEIVALCHFPPEDTPFAKFLVFALAAAVWDNTRAKFKHEEPEGESGKVDPASSNEPLTTNGPNDRRAFHFQVRKKANRHFVVCLIFFTTYFALAGQYALVSPLPAIPANTSSENTGTRIFYKPLFSSTAFEHAVCTHSGNANYARALRFIVDNEPEWLQDELDDYAFQVLITKIVLLGLLLGATWAFVSSATLMAMVDKNDRLDYF